MIETVAVDFDATLTIGDCYPFIKEINLEAIEVLKEFQSYGGVVILNTAREEKQLTFALQALKENGFIPDYSNQNSPARIKKFGTDCRKVMGDIFIDDRCIDYTGDWQKYKSILLSDENKRKLSMKPRFQV